MQHGIYDAHLFSISIGFFGISLGAYFFAKLISLLSLSLIMDMMHLLKRGNHRTVSVAKFLSRNLVHTMCLSSCVPAYAAAHTRENYNANYIFQ